MAKIFINSQIWDHPWYRKMKSAYREFWNYIWAKSDNAGIWRVDLELAQMIINPEKVIYTQADALRAFEGRVAIIDHDKWFIPSYVEFQYGTLKPDSKPHMSVIKILERHNIDPLTLECLNFFNPSENIPNPSELISNSIDTIKDKDKNKNQDKAKAFEGGAGETLSIVPNIIHAPKTPLQKSQIDLLVIEWGKTLKHFKITKDPRMDEIHIATLSNRHTVEKIMLALKGAIYEPSYDTFKPGENLSIMRLYDIKILEKLVNLGSKEIPSDGGTVSKKGIDWDKLNGAGGLRP